MTTIQRTLVSALIMRACIVLAIAMLASCTDSAEPAGPITLCGRAPASAGYTVSYVASAIGPLAQLNRDDFAALIAERNAMRAWADCVASTEAP